MNLSFLVFKFILEKVQGVVMVESHFVSFSNSLSVTKA